MAERDLQSDWIEKTFAGAIVGLGLLILYDSGDLAFWEETSPGPRLVPAFAATILIVFGTAAFFAGRSAGAAETVVSPKLIVYLALVVSCIVLMGYIGAVAAFLLFFFLELRLVEKYPLLRAAVVSAVAVTLLHLIFVIGLKLRLPQFPHFG